MAEDAKDQRYRAPALDKGLDILELLALEPGGMTRSEIVKAMGKSPSEIYRMVERLVARNYVTRSFEGDRYALSIKLFQLGSAYPPLRRMVTHVQPLMDNFSAQCLQSVHLAVPEMGQAHVVAQASSRSPWEFRLRVGAVLDLLTTSSGLTLLAFQDANEMAQMLTTAEGDTPEVTPQVAKELAEIRNTGYRIGPSQQLVGVTDISVPIRTANQRVIAVLTCPFLPHAEAGGRDNMAQNLETARDLLVEAAERASTT